MGHDLLEGFLQLAKGEEKNLSVEGLLSKEEKFEWETLVKAMDSIDILNVGKDLEKVSKTYKLSRWQELSILAYVKLLEMMVKRAREAGAIEHFDKGGIKSEINPTPPQASEFDAGSMFGWTLLIVILVIVN